MFEIGAQGPNSNVGLLLDRVNLEAYVQVHDNVGPLREHVGTTYSFELSESAANWIGIWSQQQKPFLVQSPLPPADLASLLVDDQEPPAARCPVDCGTNPSNGYVVVH